MDKSVYSKTMENLRIRADVRLPTNAKCFEKLINRPSYISQKILNKNLVAVHIIKEVLLLNRPAYVGMCILDFSKTFIYDIS